MHSGLSHKHTDKQSRSALRVLWLKGDPLIEDESHQVAKQATQENDLRDELHKDIEKFAEVPAKYISRKYNWMRLFHG